MEADLWQEEMQVRFERTEMELFFEHFAPMPDVLADDDASSDVSPSRAG